MLPKPFTKGTVSFYTMDQLYLPMDWEEDIPEDHLVRVVNEAIHRLDDRIFVSAYKRKRREVDMKYGSGSIEAKSAKVVRSKKHVR
ncbi:hypothetical protein [Paenibacillus lautus]|uniref:hypothetical protein n=1 Tax=Paenibacillus lautus TaxID=1401 RepID=UPI003D275AEE